MKTLVTICQTAPRKSTSCIVFYLVVLVGSLLPGAVVAQRSGDTAAFEARMNVLQRSLANLAAQIEQLNAGSHQLQQQLDRMRANYDQRLERLEKRATAKLVPRSGKSRP
jgi:uncharacterized protein YlxW (UPF0749 family)